MLAPLGFILPGTVRAGRTKQARWCTKYNRATGTRVPARYSLFPKAIDICEEDASSDPVSLAQVALDEEIAQSTKKKRTRRRVLHRQRIRPRRLPASGNDDDNPEPEKKQKKFPAGAIDPLEPALTGLDHAVIESVTQAVRPCLVCRLARGSTVRRCRCSAGSTKTCLLLVAVSPALPGFNVLLVDRVSMLAQPC